jgi:hypothetical protein
MDGIFEDKVICCFCGMDLFLSEAVILNIQPNIKSDEIQHLFCHKNHLVEKIDKSIMLHPDLLD